MDYASKESAEVAMERIETLHKEKPGRKFRAIERLITTKDTVL